MAIQTYGDLVNFHPHLHALVADGVFTPTGWFVAFPKIDLYTLEHLFRHRVLQMLLRERRIDEAVMLKLLGWRHSRFSLHNEVRIGAHDAGGRRAVSEYILRSPFSQEKVRYHPGSNTVIYHSKKKSHQASRNSMRWPHRTQRAPGRASSSRCTRWTRWSAPSVAGQCGSSPFD